MRVGLDALLDDARLLSQLKSSRVGLLAHPASVTRDLVHALDALLACDVRPRLLYGPEHGYGGGAQDMAHVGDARDARTSARVISLYGESFERLSPRRDELAEI